MACQCSNGHYYQDPDERLDYTIDWASDEWLEGDIIQDSNWIIPEGMMSTGSYFNTQATLVWLSGGVTGESYTVTNEITTKAGRAASQSITITIKEK